MIDQILEPKELRLATRGRREADMLLSRLLREQRLSEARRAAAGACDPLTIVTGTSALDRAIASTRDLIQRLDDFLESSPSAP